MRATKTIAFASLSLLWAAQATAAETDWSSVDTILTRKGAVSGDVHQIGRAHV